MDTPGWLGVHRRALPYARGVATVAKLGGGKGTARIHIATGGGA